MKNKQKRLISKKNKLNKTNLNNDDDINEIIKDAQTSLLVSNLNIKRIMQTKRLIQIMKIIIVIKKIFEKKEEFTINK